MGGEGGGDILFLVWIPWALAQPLVFSVDPVGVGAASCPHSYLLIEWTYFS